MVVAVELVGRIGRPPVIVVDGEAEVCMVVLVLDPGGRAHMALPTHTLSVWQHPPPSETGHGLVSGRHERGGADVVMVLGRGTGVKVLVIVVDVMTIGVVEGV